MIKLRPRRLKHSESHRAITPGGYYPTLCTTRQITCYFHIRRAARRCP